MVNNDIKENYNIRIAYEIFEILEQDIEIFNQKTRNRLINKILSTYVEVKNIDDVSEKIYLDIEYFIKNIDEKKKIKRIIKTNIYENIIIPKDKSIKTLNFRLSKEIFDKCSSLGEEPGYYNTDFFRGVFEWYTSKPKYKREKILFYEEYKKLADAIKRKVQIKLEVKKGIDETLTIYPCYPLVMFSGKDENYNYLLSAGEDRKIYPTRLSNITKLQLIQKKIEIDPKLEEEAKERAKKKYHTWGEAQEIKIKLTRNGYQKYIAVSHLRPKYNIKTSIIDKNNDNYILVFNETENSMLYYFTQFGSDFQVLQPESLKNKFKIFYLDALKSY